MDDGEPIARPAGVACCHAPTHKPADHALTTAIVFEFNYGMAQLFILTTFLLRGCEVNEHLFLFAVLLLTYY